MMWKAAEIKNDSFRDFFENDNLNGKIVYFIEGELVPKNYEQFNILNDFNIESNIDPQILTIAYIDSRNMCQSLIVPLLGVLTPGDDSKTLAMKGENISRFLRNMPDYGEVAIYAGTNEGYALSFTCGNEKTGPICCKAYDAMDKKSKEEIHNLLRLKDEKGEYLDLFEYPSRRVRLLSLRDGRRYCSPDTFPSIVKLLDDEDSFVRLKAAERLHDKISESPESDLILAIMRQHEREESKEIKRSLEKAIRLILDLTVKSADADKIVYLLRNAPKKQKEFLGVNLSLIKGGKESEEVINLLKGDDLINAYFAALYIANSCSFESWQEVLDKFHKFDRDQRRRIVGDMYHNNPDYAVDFFLKNLKECDNDKKSMFIESFSVIGLNRVLPVLGDYIDSDNETVRSAVVWAVATMSFDRQKGAFLIPKLNRIIEKDSSMHVKVGAIKAVLSLGSDKSHDAIMKAVHDTEKNVRNEALVALTRLGNPDDVDEIAKCLKDESPMVRVSALSALRSIYDQYRLIDPDIYLDPFSEFGNRISEKMKPYIYDILGLLGDDDNIARNEAVVIIRKWPAVFIINGLIDSMKDGVNPELKNNAIRIIGEMYGPYSDSERSIGDITEYLINGLSNDDPAIRNGCAQALGRRKDPCAVEELELLFKKSEECDQVKKTALWAYDNIMDYYNH